MRRRKGSAELRLSVADPLNFNLRGGFRARAQAQSAGAARGSCRAAFIPCIFNSMFNFYKCVVFQNARLVPRATADRRREAPELRTVPSCRELCVCLLYIYFRIASFLEVGSIVC